MHNPLRVSPRSEQGKGNIDCQKIEGELTTYQGPHKEDTEFKGWKNTQEFNE